MNKFTSVLVVVLLICILGSYLSVNFFFKEKANIVKWEYRIESFDDLEFQSQIQKVGQDGWELASARRAMSGEGYSSKGVYECIFKRPKLTN